MKNQTGLHIIKNDLNDRLHVFKIKSKIGFKKAWGAVGLQLLNNTVNGSPAEPVVPPIMHGYLRGSGSVFIGSELLATSDKFGETNHSGDAKPNTSYSGKDMELTIGFNAPYAARMHEGEWKPGPVSQQSGDVGNKFLEKHLKNDRQELMQLYADLVKKEVMN